jgi:histidinol phosphatase-like PHP family hydrolase
LGDLHSSQVLLPPDLCSGSGAEIVVVHQDVYSQVESDDYPRLKYQIRSTNNIRVTYHTYNRSLSIKLRITKDHGQRVMVIMKEF